MISLELEHVTVKYKTKKSKKNKIKILNSTEDFCALDDISLKINRGEVIGIIGQNGSGKSTLLKTIANVFEVTYGNVELYGNSVGLLSLGVGFDNNLSGYENIFLSGMLLGFSKKYIEEVIEDIIEFSELGEFIYKPVKTYSTGMYSKLSFSIAMHLKTDILLIDEVLSVGDIHFREKSYNAIMKLIENENTTVLIVSHLMSNLKDISDRILWIDEGRIVKFGRPKEVISAYTKFMQNKKKD